MPEWRSRNCRAGCGLWLGLFRSKLLTNTNIADAARSCSVPVNGQAGSGAWYGSALVQMTIARNIAGTGGCLEAVYRAGNILDIATLRSSGSRVATSNRPPPTSPSPVLKLVLEAVGVMAMLAWLPYLYRLASCCQQATWWQPLTLPASLVSV